MEQQGASGWDVPQSIAVEAIASAERVVPAQRAMHMLDAHGAYMRQDRIPASPKRPTNVSLDAALVADARALGVNVSAACEAGLRQELRAAREQQWREENREAIASSNAYVEKHGVPLAQYRQF